MRPEEEEREREESLERCATGGNNFGRRGVAWTDCRRCAVLLTWRPFLFVWEPCPTSCIMQTKESWAERKKNRQTHNLNLLHYAAVAVTIDFSQCREL